VVVGTRRVAGEGFDGCGCGAFGIVEGGRAVGGLVGGTEVAVGVVGVVVAGVVVGGSVEGVVGGSVVVSGGSVGKVTVGIVGSPAAAGFFFPSKARRHVSPST
jgi:hypothetical protein